MNRMAPRKRPAPAELQSNGLKVSANHRQPALSSASEAVNSHGKMQMQLQHQHHHQHHQQQTLVKSRNMNSATMTSTSTKSSSSTSSKRTLLMKHWQDELMDFSTQIARQAHFTLSRIANHFRVNGMKFDADFRNHFLYISNNR